MIEALFVDVKSGFKLALGAPKIEGVVWKGGLIDNPSCATFPGDWAVSWYPAITCSVCFFGVAVVGDFVVVA